MDLVPGDLVELDSDAPFVRVRVVGDLGSVDISLPRRRPIAQYVDAVFDRVVTVSPGVPVRFHRLGEAPFDGTTSLEDHHVREGEVLYLLSQQHLPQPALYDDVTERVTQESDALPGRWTTRRTRTAMLAWAVGAAGVLAVVLVLPGLGAAGAGGVAGLAAGVRAGLERTGLLAWVWPAVAAVVALVPLVVLRVRGSSLLAERPETFVPTDTALLATLSPGSWPGHPAAAGTNGADGVPDRELAATACRWLSGIASTLAATAGLLAGAAVGGAWAAFAVGGGVAAVVGGAVAWLVPSARWSQVALAVTGGGAALLAVASGLDLGRPFQVAAVGLVVGELLIGLAQRIAVRLGGLYAEVARGSLVVADPDIATADVSGTGRGLLRAVCIALGVLLAAAGAVATSGPDLASVLVGLVALATVLRVRRFLVRSEVAPLVGSAAAGLAVVALDVVTLPDGLLRTLFTALALGIVAVALLTVAVRWSGAEPQPRTLRWLDRLEAVVLLAMLPVLAGLLGVYTLVGDIARSAAT